jgi:hypothetical protein
MPRCVAKASKATEEKDLKIKTQGVREKFNIWTRGGVKPAHLFHPLL